MTINPYLPPRASLEPAVAAWRPNPYWRLVNWLYGIAMLIFVLFLVRGGSLVPDVHTVVTLLLFLAPLAGYYVAVSASTARAHKLWRIAHLLLLCFMFWLVVDYVLRGKPTPGAGWFLISLNVLSFTSNEIFHRHRGRVPGTKEGGAN